MEFAAGLRRFRQGVPHVPRPLAPYGLGGRQGPTRRQRAVNDAYTDLAGIFVGDGGVDPNLIGTLLDPAIDGDAALLALAAGRRAEANGRIDKAINHFREAIDGGHAASAAGVVVHGAHDCARALFVRNHPGDVDECLNLLDDAQDWADSYGMTALSMRSSS